MVCTYEQERQANIKKNIDLLKSLGLDGPTLGEKLAKPKTNLRKRRDAPKDEESKLATKRQRANVVLEAVEGVRRSARNIGKSIDYTSEIREQQVRTLTNASAKSGNEGPLGRDGGQRKYDPKTFGHIPDIEVGTWWESRQGCSADSVHAPWVAGISGGNNGAYSVALSGGYDDDVDLGYAFTYTGSGGRDLKGTKAAPKNLRSAPQSSDQSFEHSFNKALLKSVETKHPIRVIRGFKLRSKYAPSEGYRYDGLYTVEKAWMEKGLNLEGYLVCKFAFKRIPGQPPIPERGIDQPEQNEEDSS
ncbi:hypothetical protein AMATHDRAFT_52121 [Amanita thiersii Skay4041]|uniref:YDG domain-containing protein n=1 Tax=Amanita thiersii Skay4041 TaxID=703135 RepID=A0A2A9NU52_9AGAR|nr:hypothetical protein AMATHDRAFT_52121 [Amanita thiersii Skay4041]